MAAYYNEHDPFAAAWLRELVREGLIAHGVVDERSIIDVPASDLRGFTQCHFFAGIGGWSYALRLAGWPDDRAVWTGSCPCQPLSSAGKRKGHADERHLWPAFHRLIAECRPATVFGEQVASKDGREWFSAVRADLEADGYACGGADMPAAGIGAPHKRQRLWWVAQRMADANHARLEGRQGTAKRAAELAARQGGMAGRLGHPERLGAGRDAGTGIGPQGGSVLRPECDDAGSSGAVGRLEHANGSGARPQPGDHRETGEEAARRARPDDGAAVRDGAGAVGRLADAGVSSGQFECSEQWSDEAQPAEQPPCWDDAGGRDGLGRLAEPNCRQRNGLPDGQGRVGDGPATGWQQGHGEPEPRRELGGVADATTGGRREERAHAGRQLVGDRAQGQPTGLGASGSDHRPSPTNGFWRDADWLFCTDHKWRPVEPGTFPLVDGAPARVGRLRGYGNAIVPAVAATFIEAYLDIQTIEVMP